MWENDAHDKVSAVAGSGQSALTLHGFLEWAGVLLLRDRRHALVWNLRGREENDRRQRLHLASLLILHYHVFEIPAESVCVQSLYEDALVSMLCEVLVVRFLACLKLEGEAIDGHLHAT